MARRLSLLLPILSILCFFTSAIAQTTLSLNSGINSADTWVTLDLTTQTQNATMTLANAVYNPATGTISNVISVAPPSVTYHVEAGYDTSGGLVMNLWPNGNSLNPSTTGASIIRLAGGQLTVFDQNGNPLQLSLPPGVESPATMLSNLLGSSPAPTLLVNLVVPNIQIRATSLRASLALSSNSTIASLTVPTSASVSATRTYALSGSNWVVTQMSVPVSMPNFTATHNLHFANVNWNQNSVNDAARLALGSSAQTVAVAGTLSPLPTPSANPSAVASSSTIYNSSCQTISNNLGGAQNIALVHGLWSDSCAWTRMANWINQDFVLGNEVIPFINPEEPIDQTNGTGSGQGETLINDLNTYGGNNYILVGHSQGGLVSRYAAQQLQSSPTQQVEGVITVETPNQGADVTANISNGLSSLFTSEGQSMSCFFGFDCLVGSLLDEAASAIAQSVPAIQNDQSWGQLEPGSAFLNALNAQPESFKQAAVIGLTDQRWAFMRTIGNFVWGCYPEDGVCGERALASDTEIFYDVLLATSFICDFFCWEVSVVEYIIMDLMNSIDSGYNNLIDYPDSTNYAGNSDAIVQASSQFYPSSNARNFTIPHADSHTAALLSDRAHTQIYNALNAFNVPTQASCSFAIPSLDLFSGVAISSSFSLTTQAGCLWSAVSQSPWITVTPPNGTSSGTINFSVAANPSNIPRSGSINIGNGSSTQSFSIYQGGPCVYSLSPGPEVFIQPIGGSGSVAVTTYMNCPWTAEPTSTGWLNVSAGAGGTGSGSFTWTALPNAGVGARTGIINVMGQTFTVVDGSPVGTPGQGSITISGYPQSTIYYPCGTTHECPVTAQESGMIFLTVGGITFSASYGGTETAQQIAASLASAINITSLSPVNATASGSIVNLTSTIDGKAANFLLSTSNNFTPACNSSGYPICFTTPAFTAYASGSQLTGGTD